MHLSQDVLQVLPRKWFSERPAASGGEGTQGALSAGELSGWMSHWAAHGQSSIESKRGSLGKHSYVCRFDGIRGALSKHHPH